MAAAGAIAVLKQRKKKKRKKERKEAEKKEEKNSVIEIKMANILHHNVEAEIFESMHLEGCSLYERSQVFKNINSISSISTTNELCIDIGCGTDFVTSFELPLYKTVVATDISRRMLEVARKRLENFSSPNLLVCDAESLALKSEIADLVSVSSVLHHLPKPFDSMTEISRVLKKDGFLYVTREPNFKCLRRFFEFFNQVIVRLVKLTQRLFVSKSELHGPDIIVEGLDYSTVDVHYPRGLHVEQLAEFLRSKSFEVISAYTYHWIFRDSDKGLLQLLLTKSNFVIEKIPLSKKFGRYLSLIARKL
jgi:SAM-dependent methyltransferase